MSSTEPDFDYIFAGGGCAALSLVVRLLANKSLSSKKILVINKERENQNDRTWCFWERQAGLFEPIVHHSWNFLDFHSETESRRLDIAPYRYKMIRSADFYEHCGKLIAPFSSVQIQPGNIESIVNIDNGVTVTANGREYTGRYCFNSTLNGIEIDETKYILLKQHFKGWLIRTSEAMFNPGIATLMDFRISQEGGTAFFYVMPVASDKALVEYTLFTRNLLSQQKYDENLKAYIEEHITRQPYQILEQEYGIIPMTNYPFRLHNGNIFNIGTAGGQTKGSTGYTFQFIQKHSESIVTFLAETGHPPLNYNPVDFRFSLYDAVMLRVLSEQQHRGADLFTRIFTRGEPNSILRFLDNESKLGEELRIMNSLPKGLFGKAAFNELLARIW
jgi:lycopene beta-cyclase